MSRKFPIDHLQYTVHLGAVLDYFCLVGYLLLHKETVSRVQLRVEIRVSLNLLLVFVFKFSLSESWVHVIG